MLDISALHTQTCMIDWWVENVLPKITVKRSKKIKIFHTVGSPLIKGAVCTILKGKNKNNREKC